MTVVAEETEGSAATTVDLDDIGIAQAADTNDDGELSDSEIQAAIEAWRTNGTIGETEFTVNDEQILELVSTWSADG